MKQAIFSVLGRPVDFTSPSGIARSHQSWAFQSHVLLAALACAVSIVVLAALQGCAHAIDSDPFSGIRSVRSSPAAKRAQSGMVGRVVDTNDQALKGVSILITPGGTEVFSNKWGEYAIEMLHADDGSSLDLKFGQDYTLSMWKPGFHPTTQIFRYEQTQEIVIERTFLSWILRKTGACPPLGKETQGLDSLFARFCYRREPTRWQEIPTSTLVEKTVRLSPDPSKNNALMLTILRDLEQNSILQTPLEPIEHPLLNPSSLEPEDALVIGDEPWRLPKSFQRAWGLATTGKLDSEAIAAFARIPSSDNFFLMSRTLLAVNYWREGNSADSAASLAEILSLPKYRTHPVYNLELAECQFMLRKIAECLKTLELVKRGQQRFPKAVYFQRVARMIEIEAAATELLFNTTENPDYLDSVLVAWKRYRAFAIQYSDDAKAKMAETRIAELEIIMERIR